MSDCECNLIQVLGGNGEFLHRSFNERFVRPQGLFVASDGILCLLMEPTIC